MCPHYTLLYADNAHTASNIAAFSGNANGDCDTGTAGPIVYRLEAYNDAGATGAQEVTIQGMPLEALTLA